MKTLNARHCIDANSTRQSIINENKSMDPHMNFRSTSKSQNSSVIFEKKRKKCDFPELSSSQHQKKPKLLVNDLDLTSIGTPII